MYFGETMKRVGIVKGQWTTQGIRVTLEKRNMGNRESLCSWKKNHKVPQTLGKEMFRILNNLMSIVVLKIPSI